MSNVVETEILHQAMESIKKMFDIEVEFKAQKKTDLRYADGVLVFHSMRSASSIRVQFACEVKQKLTDYNINSVIGECGIIESNSGMPVLLLTNEISVKLMTILHESGINVMDASGNCYIQHEGLMMFCQGKKNSNINVRESLSFKEPGLKVLLFILTDLKNVNKPFREIQAQTGVGLATINKLFSSLKQNGYLFSTAKGRHLKNVMSLLPIFVDNYCRVMKPKNLMASMRFLPGMRDGWKGVVLPQGMEWGGEPGAFLRDGYLLPEVFDIYSTVSTSQLISAKVAVPAKDGEIRVYRKFWIGEESGKTVPTLIIYADLMGSGDSRCREAAERIFEHELSYLR